EVLLLLVRGGDGAEDEVVERGGAGGRGLEADHVLEVGLIGAIPARPRVHELRLRVLRLEGLPLGVELLLRAVAAVRLAGGDEALGRLPVALLTFTLEVGAELAADLRSLVPVEAEPAQGVEDGPHAVEAGALLVRVLDAQHEGAALAAGPEPVEQRRARAADVQITAGGGGEAHPRRSASAGR